MLAIPEIMLCNKPPKSPITYSNRHIIFLISLQANCGLGDLGWALLHGCDSGCEWGDLAPGCVLGSDMLHVLSFWEEHYLGRFLRMVMGAVQEGEWKHDARLGTSTVTSIHLPWPRPTLIGRKKILYLKGNGTEYWLNYNQIYYIIR